MRLLLIWICFVYRPRTPGCTFDANNLGKPEYKVQPISGKRFHFFAMNKDKTPKCSFL